MLPQSTIPVEDTEATAVLRLIDALEDLDDVQSVYANFDIPEECYGVALAGGVPLRTPGSA